MAKIDSTLLTAQLTVDPTSKAARQTPYLTDGVQHYRNFVGAYSAPVVSRPTGVLGAGNVMFGIINGGTKTMYFHHIELVACFEGVAAASTVVYGLRRITSGTFAGGASFVPQKKKLTMGVSGYAQVYSSDGGAVLLVGTAVFETSPLFSFSCQHQVNANALLNLNFAENDLLIIHPSEGICVYVEVTTVAGDNLHGVFEWFEV